MSSHKQTPEAQKVQQIVSEASEQTRNKEAAINNIPSDKGPQPTPPGGSIGGNSPGNKQLDLQRHKSEIGQIREGALNDTVKAIEGSPVKTQVSAYKIADDFAYPDTSSQNNSNFKSAEKDMDSAQTSAMRQLGQDVPMQDRAAERKDISASQDLSMRKIGDAKEKNNQTSPEKPAGEKFKQASMSKRFEMSLGYSKMNKSLDNATGKSEPAKSSMSDKFSASLGYNKSPEPGSGAPSPAKSDKSKGPDLGKG